MSIFFFLFLFLFLLLPSITFSERHTISLPPSSSLRPSAITWDARSSHFVLGCLPSLLSLSDAGVLHTLLSDAVAPGPVSSLAVDSIRLRLVVGFGTQVAAFDLNKSSYNRLFEVELDGEIGGVAIDLTTGGVFVSGSKRAVVWRIGLDGKSRVFSELFHKYGNEGLAGIVHVNRGYLLVGQPATGKLFKVDSEDGAVKEVLPTTNQLAPHGAHSLSLFSDHSLLVSSNKTLSLLKSDDSWAQAGIQEKLKIEKDRAVGVSVRDGKVGYVLVERESGEFRVEEIEWGKGNEGDLLWGLGLLGLGFVYFLVWRFQMGKLVSGMSKKRN